MNDSNYILIFAIRAFISDASYFAARGFYTTAQTTLALCLPHVRALSAMPVTTCTSDTLRSFFDLRIRLAEDMQFDIAAKKFELESGFSTKSLLH